MQSLAPIILFVYNRPSHTRQTIESLLTNPLAKESDLFVYSDAARNQEDQARVAQVRDYIHSINGFKNTTIIKRERNFGLAKNIIDGVTQTLNQYERTIVLEDDLLLSPHFLEYMNTALELYADEEQVSCITAFNFPIHYPTDLQESSFFIKGADCWTWATWNRAWKKFEKDGSALLSQLKAQNLQREFDLDGSYPYTKMLKDQIKGKNDSWAIRWYASAFLNDMLCLYPRDSLVENIGYEGTHFKNAPQDELFGKITKNYTKPYKIPIQENPIARKALHHFFKKHNSWQNKFLKTIQRFFR